MALSPEDLAQLAAFIGQEVEKGISAFRGEQTALAVATREATVGHPDVDPEAGPEFYVHLANGDVITSHDSGSTHMDVNGVQVAVIGRYQKGA